MVGIALGLLAANASEWAVHKYLLHGRGRNKRSYWAFHWHEHHRASRKLGHIDPEYARPLHTWNGQAKEAVMLAGSSLAIAPLFPLAPGFVGAVWYSAFNYYRKNRRSHLDPEWARAHLPWHYDHHMGPNQHANWCVTRPWFDVIMGTREPYVGTERELADRARQRQRARSARLAEQPLQHRHEVTLTKRGLELLEQAPHRG